MEGVDAFAGEADFIAEAAEILGFDPPQQEYVVDPIQEIKSLMHIVINRLDSVQASVNLISTKADLKKPRKQRTLVNRCIHKNRKNEPCCSYICKNSESLCHAHYSLYHNSKGDSYLYGHK